MIKKTLQILLALIAIIAVAFFIFAPGIAERSMNKVDGKPLPEIRPEAQALHDKLIIVDLHSDTLLWNRKLVNRADRGQMDLPRLQDGNVALQVFSSVTKTPKNQNYNSNNDKTDNITTLVVAQLQPTHTWTSLLQRSLYHAKKLDDAVTASPDNLMKIDSSASFEKLMAQRSAKKPQPVGALLSIEGLHDLEGDPANLAKLYDAGFRMASLTHFFDNDLGGSMHGEKKGGLTKMGRQIVREMEMRGMIIDIAHLSHTSVVELLAMAQRPVISSHGGVQATCNVNRNLTDQEIKGIAATGGIIGIGYWEGAVCDTSPAAIARAMKHIRDLVGIEYVALGSDFDGAVTVRFDTSKLVYITQALLDAGFSDAEIRAVMGGNAIRVLSAGIKPQAASVQPEIHSTSPSQTAPKTAAPTGRPQAAS